MHQSHSHPIEDQQLTVTPSFNTHDDGVDTPQSEKVILEKIIHQALSDSNTTLRFENFSNLFTSLLSEIHRHHAKGIFGLNIKPNNIIVDANFVCHLMDSRSTIENPDFYYSPGYIPSGYFFDTENYRLTKNDDIFAAQLILTMLVACVQDLSDPDLENYYLCCLNMHTAIDFDNLILPLLSEPNDESNDIQPIFIKRYVLILASYLRDLMTLPDSTHKIISLTHYLGFLEPHLRALYFLFLHSDCGRKAYNKFLLDIRKAYFFTLDCLKTNTTQNDSTKILPPPIYQWLQYSHLEENSSPIPALRLSDLAYFIHTKREEKINAEKVLHLISNLIRYVNQDVNEDRASDLSLSSIKINLHLRHIEIDTPATEIKFISHFAQRPQILQPNSLLAADEATQLSQYLLVARLIFDLLRMTSDEDCAELHKIYDFLISLVQPDQDPELLITWLAVENFSVKSLSSSRLSLEGLQQQLIDTLLFSFYDFYRERPNEISNYFAEFLVYADQINPHGKFKSVVFAPLLGLLFSSEKRSDVVFIERHSINLFINFIKHMEIDYQKGQFHRIIGSMLHLLFDDTPGHRVLSLFSYAEKNHTEIYAVLCEFVRNKLKILDETLRRCKVDHPHFTDLFHDIKQMISTLLQSLKLSTVKYDCLEVLYDNIQNLTLFINNLTYVFSVTVAGTLFVANKPRTRCRLEALSSSLSSSVLQVLAQEERSVILSPIS